MLKKSKGFHAPVAFLELLASFNLTGHNRPINSHIIKKLTHLHSLKLSA